MRLIDADALAMHLAGWQLSSGEEERDVIEEAIRAIDNAPTIDVAPVRHGRWEVVDAEEPRRYGCSECKRLSWNMENYCGNCGARMDGENDE